MPFSTPFPLVLLLTSCTVADSIILGVNEKWRKAGLERKVAPRNIKECLLKTSHEANALPNFKMEVANTH